MPKQVDCSDCSIDWDRQTRILHCLCKYASLSFGPKRANKKTSSQIMFLSLSLSLCNLIIFNILSLWRILLGTHPVAKRCVKRHRSGVTSESRFASDGAPRWDWCSSSCEESWKLSMACVKTVYRSLSLFINVGSKQETCHNFTKYMFICGHMHSHFLPLHFTYFTVKWNS